MYVDQNDEAEKPDKNNYIPSKYLVRPVKYCCQLIFCYSFYVEYTFYWIRLMSTTRKSINNTIQKYVTKICNKMKTLLCFPMQWYSNQRNHYILDNLKKTTGAVFGKNLSSEKKCSQNFYLIFSAQKILINVKSIKISCQYLWL